MPPMNPEAKPTAHRDALCDTHPDAPETPHAVELTRRAFCGGLCQCVLSVAGAVAGAAALGGCSAGEGDTAGGSRAPDAAGSGPATSAAVPEAGGKWRVAGGGKIAPGSSLAFTLQTTADAPIEPALLIADAKGELTALNALCTHVGCTVVWQTKANAGAHTKVQAGELRCPCHGSRFDSKGRVLQGPATRPLAKYDVQRSGDDALISTINT
ncbi:MAG: cytochrome b6-f complex iron-sulfur subunit [Abditibacteriota bacterium]|nr:cytochrome b6-f complex iron-sulfur subunit [Abditibacteriota bacterium]